VSLPFVSDHYISTQALSTDKKALLHIATDPFSMETHPKALSDPRDLFTRPQVALHSETVGSETAPDVGKFSLEFQ